MNRLSIAVATLALLLAACAGGAGDPMETDTDATDTARPDRETPGMTAPDDDGTNGDTAGVSQQMLDDLLDQASEETGVPVDEITVVTAEAVTWSDGSLGCPEEGMAYTQALVPGFRVVLDVAGEETHFHAGQDGNFIICDDPQEPIDR